MTNPSYSLKYFYQTPNLRDLAKYYDSPITKREVFGIALETGGGGNNNGMLDNSEVKLFNTQLKRYGINFDFNKINDKNYMQKVEQQYDKAKKHEELCDKLIKNMEGKYKIEKCYDNNGKLMYKITVLKEAQPANVRSDLRIPPGAISRNNSGYNQWGNNGHHIENKQMKNETIYMSAEELFGDPHWYDGVFNDYDN